MNASGMIFLRVFFVSFVTFVVQLSTTMVTKDTKSFAPVSLSGSRQFVPSESRHGRAFANRPPDQGLRQFPRARRLNPRNRSWRFIRPARAKRFWQNYRVANHPRLFAADRRRRVGQRSSLLDRFSRRSA